MLVPLSEPRCYNFLIVVEHVHGEAAWVFVFQSLIFSWPRSLMGGFCCWWRWPESQSLDNPDWICSKLEIKLWGERGDYSFLIFNWFYNHFIFLLHQRASWSSRHWDLPELNISLSIIFSISYLAIDSLAALAVFVGSFLHYGFWCHHC